jgi:hypothetical protein
MSFVAYTNSFTTKGQLPFLMYEASTEAQVREYYKQLAPSKPWPSNMQLAHKSTLISKPFIYSLTAADSSFIYKQAESSFENLDDLAGIAVYRNNKTGAVSLSLSSKNSKRPMELPTAVKVPYWGDIKLDWKPVKCLPIAL